MRLLCVQACANVVPPADPAVITVGAPLAFSRHAQAVSLDLVVFLDQSAPRRAGTMFSRLPPSRVFPLPRNLSLPGFLGYALR